MGVRVERVYDAKTRSGKDGKRYLVDRLWPRGIAKGELEIDAWLKELSPSDELRRWFRHDPEKWREFKSRYFEELREKEGSLKPLLRQARVGTVTLLFSARDQRYNQAVALKEFLNRRLSKSRKK